MARKDPRFEGNEDMKAVKLGDYYSLENIGYISGGQSTSDFVTSYEDGIKFLNFYFQAAGNSSGDARGLYMRLRLATAGTGGGEAVRAYTDVTVALTTGSVHGVHASLAFSAAGSEAGQSAAVRSTLEVAAATRTLTGTYCSLLVENNIAAGNTVDGQKVAFVNFVDLGAVNTPYLFNFDGLTVGDTLCAIQADSGAVSTIYGYARVICPDGSIGYIPIYAAHS